MGAPVYSSRITEFLFHRLMENTTENLQRIAIGSIHEVSFDPQASLLLGQKPDILAKIQGLTACPNEKTGSCDRLRAV